MRIELDEEAIRLAAADAILLTISSEKREQIVRDAVAELLADGGKDAYGYQKPSPLFNHFKSAVEYQAGQAARELLAPDTEMGRQLRGTIEAALARLMMNDERLDKIADGLANNLGEILTKEAWR